jgi:DNA-binding transcriptional LysR family regulator
MIDWDDVRYFLAVARKGSVRAAAERLRVNYSTVLRRIAELEGRLGAHVSEKLPSGDRLADAGQEVLEFAEQMEASSNQLVTRVFGRDQSVRGLLRVTLAPTLATHLLMPDFADFARLHPEVEMEILSSNEPVNLINREADVAIRVVYDRNALPPNLHGLKGPELSGGVYMSRELLAVWRAGAPDRIRWIVRNNYDPDWARRGEVRTTEVPFRITDAEAQIVAVRQGLGMTTLPCFVGDADPLMVRVPGTDLHSTGRSGFSRRVRHARRSACGSSPNSYPAGSPRTRHFSRDCPLPATDERKKRARPRWPRAADSCNAVSRQLCEVHRSCCERLCKGGP